MSELTSVNAVAGEARGALDVSIDSGFPASACSTSVRRVACEARAGEPDSRRLDHAAADASAAATPTMAKCDAR